MDEYEKIRDATHDGITRGLAGNQMVSRWVLMVEILDEEAERHLHKISSEACSMWDAAGMLSLGIALYQGEAYSSFEGD